jgi:hypothetical protein
MFSEKETKNRFFALAHTDGIIGENESETITATCVTVSPAFLFFSITVPAHRPGRNRRSGLAEKGPSP